MRRRKDILPPMTATKTRRTQAERLASTRRALIEAAIAEITAVGYTNATGVLICERAGLTRGALNHHFRDREDLMVAVCEHAYAGFAAALRAEASVDMPLPQRFEAVVRAAWAQLKASHNRALFEILVAARHDAPLLERLQPFVKRIDHHSLAEWLHLFSDLPVSRRLLEGVRDQFISSLYGMSLMTPFEWDEPYQEYQLKLLLEMALNRLELARQAGRKPVE